MYRGIHDKTTVKVVSMSQRALEYKITSKARRNGQPPMPNYLCLYTIRLLHSNYFSCSDIPADSLLMIIHTTNLVLINTTMPYHLISQYIQQLSYRNKLCCHNPTLFPCLSISLFFFSSSSLHALSASPPLFLSSSTSPQTVT